MSLQKGSLQRTFLQEERSKETRVIANPIAKGFADKQFLVRGFPVGIIWYSTRFAQSEGSKKVGVRTERLVEDESGEIKLVT